jgi:SAM-dependent methyltransferase
MDQHLRAVSRVYGPETWDLYRFLDRSLAPRGPDAMHALAMTYLTPGSTILDVGCRDGAHLIRLVRASHAAGIGLDPVGRLVEQARRDVDAARLNDRLQIVRGVAQHLPIVDGRIDLVWLRDVVEVLDDLERALAEVARVLCAGGYALVYSVFVTDLLEPNERRMLDRNLANVPTNLVEPRVEAAFARAGLSIARKDVIGTEWREYAEEHEPRIARELLHLARLRRQRDQIVREFGADIYLHVEANLHWSVFQFLGKLQPILYLLRR